MKGIGWLDKISNEDVVVKIKRLEHFCSYKKEKGDLDLTYPEEEWITGRDLEETVD